jgi:gamma-tubulin complex component 2
MAKLNAKEDSKGGASPVRTVDELMQDHVDFLDTCLKECMLTNSRLLRVCFQGLAGVALLNYL